MLKEIHHISYSQLELYKSLFDSNPDASYVLNLEGNFLYVNDSAVNLSGYSREELVQMSFVTLLKVDDIERISKYFENVKKGNIERFETSFKTKSGKFIDLYITATPIVIDEKIQGLIGIGKI
ncbi:PAS domain S-box protein [Bacillus songklensis]|uniref:PAS domain S-box protein n=1 Tax=Bacillus songklensis TaxID=1069116 RepID=A0ABV8AWF3_9BACI